VVPEPDKLTQAVHKKLAETVDELVLDKVPAADAFAYFRGQFGLNVFVEWRALEAADIQEDTPTTVSLKKVTVARALRAVLENLGGQVSWLDFAVDEGVIVISTWDALGKRTLTRTYPVADLLCRTRLAFPQCGGVPWHRTIFLPPDKADEEPEEDPERDQPVRVRVDPVEDLFGLLRLTVDPNSWWPTGEIGTFCVVGTNLVVTQTPANHEAIEKLLAVLRSAREAQRLAIGLAVVRTDNPEARRMLATLVAKGGDVREALTDGENDGRWALDRCMEERGVLGEVVLASHVYRRRSQTVNAAGEEAFVLDHTTLAGYQIGLLPVSREGESVSLSVACGAAWLGREEDPNNDTPEANLGTRARHNTFEFALKPGQARLLPVIPLTAKDGGVMAVVWLPKEAQAR